MLKAIDSSGMYVEIDDAYKDRTYYCPICNQPLIQKRGIIKAHHFAHYGVNSEKSEYMLCSDRWNYDKSDWHIEWQKRFPEKCYEVVVSNRSEKHIADVLINNTVIEFQHSSISLDDFNKRNKFYISCGYKVVWVFDFIEEYAEGNIFCSDMENEFRWGRPKKLFRELNYNDTENIALFFQLSDESVDYDIEKVRKGYNEFRLFYTYLNKKYTIDDFVKKIYNEPESFFYKKVAARENTGDISVPNGKTIFQLWKPEYTGMRVINFFTGKEMIINGKKGRMRCEQNNPKYVLGQYLENGQKTNGEYYPVCDADKEIWKLGHAFYSSIDDLIGDLTDSSMVVKNIKTEKEYYLEIDAIGNYKPYDFNSETGEIEYRIEKNFSKRIPTKKYG